MAPPMSVDGPFFGMKDFESFPERYGWSTEDESGYKIKEQLYATERPLRVICLGAGMGGICLAKFLKDQLKNVSLNIYDKNPEVGGTWYENRYPGVACDIPSHAYQFSWARNPDWTQFYSEGPEILRYFQDVAERFNLTEFFHLNHQITGAYWDEERGLWDVHVKNILDGSTFIDSAEVFINCGGILNAWEWPKIEGLSDFKGKLCHTAAYDESIDLAGKRVAVLGIGSSGVQTIPSIIGKVSKLYTWIRSPTWITSGFAQKYAGPNGANFNYTEEQKKVFRENPEELLEYCKKIEADIGAVFPMLLKGTTQAQGLRKFCVDQMRSKLQEREDIISKLIPTTFPVGCRRPTPGNGFLEALVSPKTEVFFDPLKRLTEKGFIDHNGKEYEVDVFICATGFEPTWVPRFPIMAHGVNVQDIQRGRPISYLSLAVPDIPNYFTLGGPYFSFAVGSYTSTTELFATNILQIIKKIQRENVKSLAPRKDVSEEFVKHADLWIRRTAWNSPCSNWFKNSHPEKIAIHFPASKIVTTDLLLTPRYEDYLIKYWGKNRWEFLGNGFGALEYDGGDVTWYLGTKENPGGVLPEDFKALNGSTAPKLNG